MHLWLEIDDFLRYFRWWPNPTGIGRVQREIIAALLENHSSRVSFCRLGRTGKSLELVSQDQLLRILQSHDEAAKTFQRSRVRGRCYLLMRNFLEGSQSLLGQTGRYSPRKLFAQSVKPGDVLLNLGAPWAREGYCEAIRAAKKIHQIGFCSLIHDIMPVTHLNYVSPKRAPEFIRWLDEMTSTWDIVLTPSDYSKKALASYLESKGKPVPPMHKIPYGSGFGQNNRPSTNVRPFGHSFVLFVSTIEVRKNHILLFRIWRKLIEKHGPEAIPKLVFAGKYGWEIEDLKRELADSNHLNGKIVVAGSLSDEAVGAAYRDCLFTVFPSHCEGWGLPVSESLANNKYCIASNATSVPEVAGPFADYFDPNDENTAFQLIEKAILDPGYVHQKEQDIANNYVKPSWHDTASFIVHLLNGSQESKLKKIVQ